jgi:hypothetical protein
MASGLRPSTLMITTRDRAGPGSPASGSLVSASAVSAALASVACGSEEGVASGEASCELLAICGGDEPSLPELDGTGRSPAQENSRANAKSTVQSRMPGRPARWPSGPPGACVVNMRARCYHGWRASLGECTGRRPGGREDAVRQAEVTKVGGQGRAARGRRELGSAPPRGLDTRRLALCVGRFGRGHLNVFRSAWVNIRRRPALPTEGCDVHC